MGKDWDYAKLVHDVSEGGGVDAWLETIKKNSYNCGANDMKNMLVLPLLATGITIGSVGALGVQKLNKYFKKKKEEKILTEQEALEAENLLKEKLFEAIEEMKTDNANLDE